METEQIVRIKRDIFDGYKMASIYWAGKLSEVDFLSRLYDLTSLPSTDGRFNDMSGDIWQHCINNDDWDAWWIINDDRLQLSDFERLKKFIEETVHPLVRPDTEVALTIVDHVNGVMEAEGIQERLVPTRHFMSKPIFSFKKTGEIVGVELEQKKIVANTFIEEQIKKCKEKLEKGDNDGAITNARSLIEGVFGDIHERITGRAMPDTGDLKQDFKKIQKILNLSHEQHSDDAAKGVISGLSAMLHNLDVMSNKMGDRHRPKTKAERHHAKLCIDAALAISDFLYASLVFQHGSTTDLYSKLIDALDSDLRLTPRDQLMQDAKIKHVTQRLDEYTSRILIERFLSEFIIPTFNGYRNNDIFFAALGILIGSLNKADIEGIYQKCKDNGQAVGLSRFLRIMEKERPDIEFSVEVREYLRLQPE
jgi:hypothetical protein